MSSGHGKIMYPRSLRNQNPSGRIIKDAGTEHEASFRPGPADLENKIVLLRTTYALDVELSGAMSEKLRTSFHSFKTSMLGSCRSLMRDKPCLLSEAASTTGSLPFASSSWSCFLHPFPWSLTVASSLTCY